MKKPFCDICESPATRSNTFIAHRDEQKDVFMTIQFSHYYRRSEVDLCDACISKLLSDVLASITPPPSSP